MFVKNKNIKAHALYEAMWSYMTYIIYQHLYAKTFESVTISGKSPKFLNNCISIDPMVIAFMNILSGRKYNSNDTVDIKYNSNDTVDI